MGWEAPWHWIILAVIVIALFGYKKMPDAARAMGRSLRIFKTEIKGMSDDDKARETAREQAQLAPAPTDVVPPQTSAPVAAPPVAQPVAQPVVQPAPQTSAPVSTPGAAPLASPVPTPVTTPVNGTHPVDGQ